MARGIADKGPLAVAAMTHAVALCEFLTLHEGYRFEHTQPAALARTDDK